MNLGFALKFHLFMGVGHAVFKRGDLCLAGNHVVARPGRDALGELAAMVRYQVPGWMLLALRMDRDPDSIHGMIVRPISCPGDQSIMSAQVFFVLSGTGGGK
jgi:hypothetical protein